MPLQRMLAERAGPSGPLCFWGLAGEVNMADDAGAYRPDVIFDEMLMSFAGGAQIRLVGVTQLN